MIEGIEKLRENTGPCSVFRDIADEIEAEIEEKYTLLPVDADGVPIHVGDELCGYGLPDGGAIVRAVNGSMVIVGPLAGGENYAKHGLLWCANETHHVKPRTLDDILEEFANLPERIDRITAIDRYANEIRELLAGDAK